ncbi:MAG: hypothetical protein LBK08_10450 [Treponema sp.]|nr:hypothetical protein [Treponema sp.]
MTKSREQKEQLEQKILELLSRYRASGGDSMESEREKVFGKLVDAVWQLYKDLLIVIPVAKKIRVIEPGKKTRKNEVQREDLGAEIYYAVKSCAAGPYEGPGFFDVLKMAIRNENTASYYREEADLSKRDERRISYCKRLMTMLEESENRIISENKQIEIVSQAFHTSLERAAEYFEIDRRRNVVENNILTDSDGKKQDVFDTIESPDYSSSLRLDKWFAENARFILQTAEAVIDEKHKNPKIRECLKELFTLRYVDKLTVDKLTELIESGGPLSFASEEIIRTKANGAKLPAPYEIWQKYYPNAAKLSAGSRASGALAKLRKPLQKKLRELQEEYRFQRS